MPIIIVLGVIGLLYFLQDRIYRRYWDKNLHAEVDFTDQYIHEGQSTELSETLSNGKVLPLPWVYVKFRIDRNGKAEHYRSDLFSIRFFQQIRRRIPYQPKARGIYTIRGIDLISNNLLITNKFVKMIPDRTQLYVYPRMVPYDQFQVPFQRMMGDIVTRRFMIEDPYMFRGIRDYEPHDSLKSINFKASARAGKWLVNQFDYTISQRVILLLDMDRVNRYYDPRLYEYSIRLAVSLAEAFDREGVPLSLVSNGLDVLTGKPVTVEEGAGSGHLHTIFQSLTRMDVALDVEDFVPQLLSAAEDPDPDNMYLLIAPYFGKTTVEAYQALAESHPETQWILPVTLADLSNPEFKGQELCDEQKGVSLWKID